jgi:hypothetical protein
MPVLLHPYWGMFSDYIQIVESCRIQVPHGFLACLIGACFDFRPGAHLLDYLTWFIAPEQPRAFYIIRWLAFFATLSLTFLSCLKLSKSLRYSLLSVSLFFFAKPTFEVLYTLDKGESFIACLLALVVWLNTCLERSTRQRQLLQATVLLLVSTYAMFTKQTAQLLVVYAASAFACSFLSVRDDEGKLQNLTRPGWPVCFLAVTCTAWLIYHLYYRFNGGFSFHRYNEMDYGAVSMFNRLVDYAVGMPEILIPFCILVGMLIVLSRRSSIWDDSSYRESVALMAAFCFGALALCSWPAEICYTFYPLLVFLLPALAYALTAIHTTSRLTVAMLVALSFLIQLPFRIEDAQVQHAMDGMFFELKNKLIALGENATAGSTVVLPFTDKHAFELGNTLRGAVCDDPSVIASRAKSLKVANTIQFWNPGARDSIGVFNCKGYEPHPGLEKCTLVKGDWEICGINPGDYMVVPWGDLKESRLSFRGKPMFEKGWSDWVRWMGQLDLEPVFQLSRTIWRPGRQSQTIGWICLKVTDSPHVSIGCVDDGWVLDGCEIYTDSSSANKTLSLTTSRRSHRLRSLKIDADNSSLVIPEIDRENTSVFNIPLHANLIRVHPTQEHDKPLFLIKDVKVLPAPLCRQ